MSILGRQQKDFILRIVRNSIFEKPFLILKNKFYVLSKNKYGKNFIYDQETQKIIMKLGSDSNCIDIGCHKGQFLKDFLVVSPNGKHFAFEPIPELFENLRLQFQTTNLFQIALSKTKGSTVFYNVVTGQGVSGLKEREYDRQHKTVKINVDTDLLDNIIPKDLPIDFIKIDIEGGEFDAMLGGKDLIEKYKPIIVFEFEKGAADKYGVTPEMMYDFVVNQMKMKLSLQKYWLKGNRVFCYRLDEFESQFETGENFYFIAFE